MHFKCGDQLVLFNDETERIYQLDQVEQPHSVHLKLVAEQDRQLPQKHIYLLWALQDNYEDIINKSTELGCTNFIPIVADKCDKTSFEINRAKIDIIEATEKSGRAEIPNIREPISVDEAMAEYADLPLFICEAGEDKPDFSGQDKVGLLVEPSAGWSDREQKLISDTHLQRISIIGPGIKPEISALMGISKLLQ